jgi:SNF2 family DNA or RNA helicase
MQLKTLDDLMALDEPDEYMVVPQKWTPLPYQMRATKFLLQHASAALLLDPGGRKTSCTLAAIKILFAKGMIKKVLIIAPLRPCYDVWPTEIEKWCEFNHLTYAVLHGDEKDEELARDVQICIINPAGLDWLLRSVRTKYKATGRNKFTGAATVTERTKVDVNVRDFKKFGFDVLVIDELTQFKHTNTQRFMALEKVRDTFRYIWGLTGSPAANGLMDLFGQCLILDGGRTLGQYITHYRASYFTPDSKGIVWKLGKDCEKLIYERIAPLALRLDPSEYVQLPEMVPVEMFVTLPTDVQRAYDELERDLITGIANQTIVAANAASASIKLRQFTGGGIYHTPTLVLGQAKKKREWSLLHEEKINALLELVDELQGSPLLVAYEFMHDLDHLRKAFAKHDGIVFACDVKMKDFSAMVRKWNAGEIRVLFGHPQAIGHGLNLQENGNHVCWFTLTWNYELYDQFNRRVLRSGNTASRVFVHHIMARSTIDMAVLAALRSKESGQNALFAALQEYAKKKRRK